MSRFWEIVFCVPLLFRRHSSHRWPPAKLCSATLNMLRAKGRNIVGQQLPTLLDVTCCVCLHSLLHLVACCWELLRKVWNRSNFKLCANGLNSLANNAATVCTKLKNEISFRSSKNNAPCREQTKCKKLRCPVLPIPAGHQYLCSLFVSFVLFNHLCGYGWDRGPHYIVTDIKLMLSFPFRITSCAKSLIDKN